MICLTQEEASKHNVHVLSEGLRNTFWVSKSPNFPGGACTQIPLDGWWFFFLKSEPPHFCRAFSTLAGADYLAVSIPIRDSNSLHAQADLLPHCCNSDCGCFNLSFGRHSSLAIMSMMIPSTDKHVVGPSHLYVAIMINYCACIPCPESLQKSVCIVALARRP